MTRLPKHTMKELAQQLDNMSAVFLVGKALLEPYITMGQPNDTPPPDATPILSKAQPSDRHDPTNYAAFPPHEHYGNIYFPYHIEQTRSTRLMLRYRVIRADGMIAVSDASWVEATEITRRLNTAEHSSGLQSEERLSH